LAACQTVATQALQPALLSHTSSEVTESLRAVLVEATGFHSVVLSERDLTVSSWITIERRQKRTPIGNVLQGRDLEMPQRLQLLTRDGQCWLQHEASRTIYPLPKAHCRPA